MNLDDLTDITLAAVAMIIVAPLLAIVTVIYWLECQITHNRFEV